MNFLMGESLCPSFFLLLSRQALRLSLLPSSPFCLVGEMTYNLAFVFVHAQKFILFFATFFLPCSVFDDSCLAAPAPREMLFRGDSGRSTLGYAGLQNLGCTCYMNNMLQQVCYGVLFAIFAALLGGWGESREVQCAMLQR